MIGNVMIVDDSPLDRKVIGQVIKNRFDSINVVEVEDGLDILHKLTKNNIHMLILDIRLPFKNGYEILKEIKQDPELRDIPVIICTGLNDNQSIEMALSYGAYDYFSKPLSEEAMKISLPLKVKNAINFMKRKEEIIYLSYHDKLTGLYNRRYFEKALKTIDGAPNLPVSIVMGDVNELKLINDAFGYNKGDKMLQKVASAILNICRDEDIVARWGGDEFAIIMPKISNQKAESVVNMIKNFCSKEQVSSLTISVSFGWSTKTKLDEDIQKILKKAEDRMFRNKIIESKGNRSSTINTVINTLHEKNPREEQHSNRVSEISQKIGIALRLSETEINTIKVAGLLHDIGKIAIDEAILNKNGRLSEEEWDAIKRHPDIGYRILNISYDMSELADYVLAHHERWDGKGYPKGLHGEEIPKEARIIALADSYDAMTSLRPYRRPLTEEEACRELRSNAGTQFDPYITKIFLEQVLLR